MRRIGWGSVALAGSLAGCGRSKADPEGPLDFWAMGREAEVVTALLAAFHSRHPTVQVRVQQLPWTAAHEKLLTAYAGDALPDLCQLGNTWLPEFSALGALEPLDERMAGAGIPRDDYFAGVFDTNLMPAEGGASRLLGVPWYVDTRLLFYRTDLLRAAGHAGPPQTWSEWRTAMQDIRRLDGGRATVHCSPSEPDPLFAPRSSKAGAGEDDTRGAFSQPPSGALGFRGVSREASRRDDECRSPASGTFGAACSRYVSGPWNIGEFSAVSPAPGRWAARPPPGPDGPGLSTRAGRASSCSRARRASSPVG
jgi:multiple sugar transport system substrate-binding protein